MESSRPWVSEHRLQNYHVIPEPCEPGKLWGKLGYKIRTTDKFRDLSRDVSSWRHHSQLEKAEEESANLMKFDENEKE